MTRLNRRAAFTLVEMMVALAITGVLTVMMLRMFSDSSTIWKAEDDRLDTFREARAALQLMSRELATALPLPNAANPGGTEQYPALALRDRKTARDVKDATELPTEYYSAAYLLAAVPNSGRGDLCAVGYFVEWEPDIVTPKTTDSPASTPPPRSAYVLRRQVAQSDTTFARLRETLNPTAPLFGEAAFAKLFARTAPAAATGTVARPAPTIETIASYIWDLQFAVAPPLVAPPVSAAKQNAYYGTELPQWIEIRFKALGSTAARKLSSNPAVNKELWTMPKEDTYSRLILPAEQQFVSRVKLTR